MGLLFDIGSHQRLCGFLERTKDGNFDGEINIEGVDLSPITGVFFEEGKEKFLWLRRRPLLVYDYEHNGYLKRPREPRWETYLTKKAIDGTSIYKGTCFLLHIKYELSAIWDGILKSRMNLYIERLPLEKQNIINSIRDKNNGEE